MGGKPLTALNIVGFPDSELDASVLGDILRGGAEKAKEAGIDIVGGHTIKTDEPIYGLAVTGWIYPDKIVSNAGGKPGDVLVLTKPLGLGIISTASKQEKDTEGAIREAIRVMCTLNRSACEAMVEVGANAATDITGFGLLGHLRNIVAASGCTAEPSLKSVPVLPSAWKYVREGIAHGGTHANWQFLSEWVEYLEGVDKESQLVLCDAQTSGGLLIAVSESKAAELVERLKANGTLCADNIGGLTAGKPRIQVSA